MQKLIKKMVLEVESVVDLDRFAKTGREIRQIHKALGLVAQACEAKTGLLEMKQEILVALQALKLRNG